jgi:hypothetical protein
MIKNFLSPFKRIRFWIGLVIGALAGYLYFRYVGCASGGCPITSNPYSTILYGMFIGGLIGYEPIKKIENIDVK